MFCIPIFFKKKMNALSLLGVAPKPNAQQNISDIDAELKLLEEDIKQAEIEVNQKIDILRNKFEGQAPSRKISRVASQGLQFATLNIKSAQKRLEDLQQTYISLESARQANVRALDLKRKQEIQIKTMKVMKATNEATIDFAQHNEEWYQALCEQQALEEQLYGQDIYEQMSACQTQTALDDSEIKAILSMNPPPLPMKVVAATPLPPVIEQEQNNFVKESEEMAN